MKPTLAALVLSIAALVSVPALAPVAQAAPPASLRGAPAEVSDVRDQHERMAAAQRRMRERHHIWVAEAQRAGAADEQRWTLQWEHEELLDAHRELVERSEWLLCSNRSADEIAREQTALFREHRRLLGEHLRLRAAYGQMVRVALAARAGSPVASR